MMSKCQIRTAEGPSVIKFALGVASVAAAGIAAIICGAGFERITQDGQISSPNKPVPVYVSQVKHLQTVMPVIEERLPHWQTVPMRVTAYCPCRRCCGRFADGYTANGHRIQKGERFAAADKKYPFGTEIIVPGYNGGRPIEVLDRGGAIKANRLDVFFESHVQAVRWGVKYLNVKVRTE
jgi:3D (Asp-Asp-Asp) domain-containing protein